jgi:hypothetical protein
MNFGTYCCGRKFLAPSILGLAGCSFYFPKKQAGNPLSADRSFNILSVEAGIWTTMKKRLLISEGKSLVTRTLPLSEIHP